MTNNNHKALDLSLNAAVLWMRHERLRRLASRLGLSMVAERHRVLSYRAMELV